MLMLLLVPCAMCTMQTKVRNAELKKINSKLGDKQIVNSFVVQKTRSRKRVRQGAC